MSLGNPWRRLRSLPHIDLMWHDDGPRGWYDFNQQVISLRRGMTQAERRSTLRHELEHHYRGRALAHLLEREEQACEIAAARDLISIHALGEALAWTDCRFQAADELWIDVDLLDIRLANLHPSERQYLLNRLNAPRCP